MSCFFIKNNEIYFVEKDGTVKKIRNIDDFEIKLFAINDIFGSVYMEKKILFVTDDSRIFVCDYDVRANNFYNIKEFMLPTDFYPVSAYFARLDVVMLLGNDGKILYVSTNTEDTVFKSAKTKSGQEEFIQISTDGVDFSAIDKDGNVYFGMLSFFWDANVPYRTHYLDIFNKFSGDKHLLFFPKQYTKDIVFTKISFYLSTLFAIDQNGHVYLTGTDRSHITGENKVVNLDKLMKLDTKGIKFIDVCQNEFTVALIDTNNNLWISKYDRDKVRELSILMEGIHKIVSSYDGSFYVMSTEGSFHRIDPELNIERTPELDFATFPGESIRRKTKPTKSARKF